MPQPSQDSPEDVDPYQRRWFARGLVLGLQLQQHLEQLGEGALPRVRHEHSRTPHVLVLALVQEEGRVGALQRLRLRLDDGPTHLLGREALDARVVVAEISKEGEGHAHQGQSTIGLALLVLTLHRARDIVTAVGDHLDTTSQTSNTNMR
eukprot:1182264-Prorocentrum_minimum.AAC.1